MWVQSSFNSDISQLWVHAYMSVYTSMQLRYSPVTIVVCGYIDLLIVHMHVLYILYIPQCRKYSLTYIHATDQLFPFCFALVCGMDHSFQTAKSLSFEDMCVRMYVCVGIMIGWCHNDGVINDVRLCNLVAAVLNVVHMLVVHTCMVLYS